MTAQLPIHCVAGTTVPAFVERVGRTLTRWAGRCVSPGLRSRPSLSALGVARAQYLQGACVAGTTVPAFVERRTSTSWPASTSRVSPGLRSRPSLSAEQIPGDQALGCGRVSPGLRSRPSLSGANTVDANPISFDVSPGLRSRPSLSALHTYDPPTRRSSVAGTTVPAFVERRPSTSAAPRPANACRRDYGPGLR